MASRLWTPADMVGVTGVEYGRGNKNVSADTSVTPSPVTGITMVRPGGGTPTAIVSFRDDFRPVLGAYNGLQTVLFDTSTRQLDIPTKTNLPNGAGDKWWFSADKIRETRTDDRYTWGYGGGNGSGVAYKMRQGGVPYCDIGSVGYAVGSVAVATTGISILSEYYTATDTTSRARYNGNPTWTSYVRSRNTSTSNAAHFGNWPLYGNGSSHDLIARAWGYGTPSTDDWARLEGWASWDSGDNGASLVDGHAYKNAAPQVDDGTGGASATPANGAQVQSGSSPTVTPRTFAAPTDGSQGQVGSQASVTARAAASPADGSQAQEGTSPSAFTRLAAAPADGNQAQTGSQPSTGAANAAQPGSGSQGQQGDTPVLSPRLTAAPSSGSQVQTGSQPTTGGANTAQPGSGSQMQQGSTPVVASRFSAAPASGLQSQQGSLPTVSVRFAVAPGSGLQTQQGAPVVVTGRVIAQPFSGSQAQIGSLPIVAWTVTTVAPPGRTVVLPARNRRIVLPTRNRTVKL